MPNYKNFFRHLENLRKEICYEGRSDHHTKYSIQVIKDFCSDLKFDTVVELGCGMAPVLDKMKRWNKKTLGVTLGNEKANHQIIKEDMHFTELEDKSFDMVVSRHSLEHSPMPLILLMEMRRIAKKYALIILPSPTKKMIDWSNHYSIFYRDMWEKLFKVARWRVLKYREIRFYYHQPDDQWDWEYQYLLEVI